MKPLVAIAGVILLALQYTIWFGPGCSPARNG